MKYIFILITISFQIITYAQSNGQARTNSEILTLEKLHNLQKEDQKEEIEAQNQIFNFKNQTSDSIRSNQSKITSEEYNSLIALEKALWNQILERKKLYNSSKKFLSSEYSLLSNYREKVLNRLYQYINNQESQIVATDENTNIIIKENKELDECYKEYQKLINYTKELKSQNEALINQNQALKIQNSELIESLKKITVLTQNGAENLEKALESLKIKDKKIMQLQETITENYRMLLIQAKKEKNNSNE